MPVLKLVDDLAVIIRMLKIAPAHLVGHSYRGAIAYHLALRHPELVRTLVLAEPVITSGRHSVAAAPSVFAGCLIRNAEATWERTYCWRERARLV